MEEVKERKDREPVFNLLDEESCTLLESLPEWARVSRYRTRKSTCPWRYRITLTEDYPIHCLLIGDARRKQGYSKAFNIPASKREVGKKGTPTFGDIVITLHRIIQYHMGEFLHYLNVAEKEIQWDILEEAMELTRPLRGVIGEPLQKEIDDLNIRYQTSRPDFDFEPRTQESDIESVDTGEEYKIVLSTDRDDGKGQPLASAGGLDPRSILNPDPNYRSSEDSDYEPTTEDEDSDDSDDSDVSDVSDQTSEDEVDEVDESDVSDVSDTDQ